MMYTSHDGKTFSSYKSLCEHEMMFGPNKNYWTAEYNKCKDRDEKIVNALGGQKNSENIAKLFRYALFTFIAFCLIYMFIAE